MLKPEQVPDAAAFALDDARKDPDATLWDFIAAALNADLIAAAINAWPHVALSTHVDEGRRIILPLPQEASDE